MKIENPPTQMQITESEPMFYLPTARIVITTKTDGFSEGYGPRSSSHNDGDVVSESERKSWDLDAALFREGQMWVYTFESNEDRRRGFESDSEHWMEYTYSSKALADLEQG